MTSLTPLQESIATLIGWSLIHSLWLAAALVAVVQICLALLPKSTAQTRYALYLLALFSIPAGAISCAAILHDADSQPAIVHENVGVATDVSTPRVANDGPEPLAEVAQANVSSHFTTTSTESEALTVPRVGATVVRRRPTSPKIDPAAVPVGLANEASTSLADRAARWMPWMVWIWMAGVAALSLRLLVGCFILNRLSSCGTLPISSEMANIVRGISTRMPLTRAVRVMQSTMADVPTSIGFFHPVILLPVSTLTSLSAKELESILAHEFAHVCRGDFLVNAFQMIVEVLIFYHPAVWWLSRRIRQEREHACDDMAILVTGNRLQYARALTAVAENATQNRLAVAANGGNLSLRIQRILRRGDVAKPRRSHVLTATILGAILVSCLFALVFPADSTANSVAADSHGVPNTGKLLEPISGKVVDSKGAPLAGVTVYLRRRPFRSNDSELELAEVVTSELGIFEFRGVEAPDLIETQMTRIYPLDVIAMKPGFGIRWRRLTNAKTDISLQLKPEARFVGVIKDDAGKPVADTKIRVRNLMSLNTITKINTAEGQTPSENGDSYLDISESTAEISSTTDAQGRLELSGLPHRVGVVFEVDDRRFVKSQWYAATTNEELPQIRAGKIVYPPNPNTVGQIMQRRAYSELVPIHNSPAELAITRGVHLRYRVLDEATGEPVPLAKLVVQDSPPREALTDPNGSCDFYQFAPNSSFRLRVLAPEQSTFIDWQDKVELTADLSDDREIRLCKGAVVKGQVVDATTRLGVPDARVSFIPEVGYSTPTAPRQVTTDGNGGFRFVVPAKSGRVVLTWAPAGYLDMHQGNDAPLVQPSLDDPITGLTIDVLRRPSIPFKFVTDQGDPVAVKATLRTYFTSNSYRQTLEQIEESEVFDVGRLIAGARSISAIQILVRSRDDRLAAFFRSKEIASLQGEQAREIVLLPTATVHGRILNKETNEPIAEAKASISVSYTPRGGQHVGNFTCDEQGKFHFEQLVPGMQYSIGASAEDFSARNSIHNRFVAKAAESHTVDIALVPNAPKVIVNLGPLKVASVEGLSSQEAYETLTREYDKAYKAYEELMKQYRSDKAHSNRTEMVGRIVALREPTPAYAQAMMTLANDHRASSVELQALKWVCKARLIAGTESRHRPLRIEAAARLLEEYHDSPQLANVVSNVIYNSPNPYDAAEKLMKSPVHEVQGRACLVAANMLSQRYLDPFRGGHDELREQAIELYEKVVDRYADITYWNKESIASEAKDRLFELRDLQLGAVAPEIEGVDLDGKPMKLSDFRGKVVVIHYWESGLGSFDRLKQMADEYKDRPLVIVGVNTDKDSAKAKSQAAKSGVMIRHWHDPKRDIHARWSGCWPDTHVIGHDGKILYRGDRKTPTPLEDVLDKAVSAAE